MAKVTDLLKRVVASPGFALAFVACGGSGQGTRSEAPSDSAAALESYKDAHFKAVGRTVDKVVTRDEMLARVGAVRVLYLGDSHADRALHATQREILAELLARPVRPVIVLEALAEEDEPAVRRFLAKQIGEAELRRAISERTSDNWVIEKPDVDSAHFMALLAFARANGIPVHGLEPVPRKPLASRDALMADNIKRVNAQHPDRLLVVMVGEAHLLGDSHLVARAGLPNVVVGSHMVDPVARSAHQQVAHARDFYQSDRGVLFFATARRHHRSTTPRTCRALCGSLACVNATVRYSCTGSASVSFIDVEPGCSGLSAGTLAHPASGAMCSFERQDCECG